MPSCPALPCPGLQEYEKTTGKVSSQSKEAFRAALVSCAARACMHARRAQGSAGADFAHTVFF